MGQRVECTIEYKGKRSKGAALLETTELVFRGDFRLVVPLKKVESVEAKGGALKLKFGGEATIFQLDPGLAEKWANKILHPKSLIDKLGIKPGSRVSVLGVKDKHFERQLREKTTNVFRGRTDKELDAIVFLAETRDDLGLLGSLAGSIAKAGMIWTIFPKGTQAIREAHVIAAAKQSGLVDTKVVSFSDTHTGLKLVIPRERR